MANVGDILKQCALASGTHRAVLWIPIEDARKDRNVGIAGKTWTVTEVYQTRRIIGKDFDQYLG